MDVTIKCEAKTFDHLNPTARRYPFEELQVGEGMAVKFPVPFGPASSAASKWAKANGWKFKRTRIDGVRVIVRVA